MGTSCRLQTSSSGPVFMVLLIYLTTVCPFSANAATNYCYSLFNSSSGASAKIVSLSSKNLEYLVTTLSPGDSVQFSDGVLLAIKEVVSVAGTDGIFVDQNDRILRLPKYSGETIDQYIDGYPALVDAGIPVPKILSYRRGEHILVEKINIQFHLSDLFMKGVKLKPDEFEQLRIKFLEFVIKFRDFNQVSDIHAEQIIYVKDQGWMLLDWRDRHQFGSRVNPFRNVWDSLPVIAERKKITLDTELARSWRESSDESIARARNQDPQQYFTMSAGEARKILIEEMVK